jgi:hypothetical protein
MAFYWWQRGNGTWVYYDDTWGHHIEVDPDGTQRERKGPPPEHDMPDSGLRPPGVVPGKVIASDGLPGWATASAGDDPYDWGAPDVPPATSRGDNGFENKLTGALGFFDSAGAQDKLGPANSGGPLTLALNPSLLALLMADKMKSEEEN